MSQVSSFLSHRGRSVDILNALIQLLLCGHFARGLMSNSTSHIMYLLYRVPLKCTILEGWGCSVALWRGRSPRQWAASDTFITAAWAAPSCLFLPVLPPLLSQLYRPNYLWGQTNNQMSSFNSNQFTYVFSTVLTNICVNTSEGVTRGQEQASRDEAAWAHVERAGSLHTDFASTENIM